MSNQPIALTDELKSMKLALFCYSKKLTRYGEFEQGFQRKYVRRSLHTKGILTHIYSARYSLGKLCNMYILSGNKETPTLEVQLFSTMYLRKLVEGNNVKRIIMKNLKFSNPSDAYCLAIIHHLHQFIQVGSYPLPELICAGGREALYLVKAGEQFALHHHWDKKTRYHSFERGAITTSMIPDWN